MNSRLAQFRVSARRAETLLARFGLAAAFLFVLAIMAGPLFWW